MDFDLSARQEARELARAAAGAAGILADFPPEKLDEITRAVCEAFLGEAESLAAQAVEETGFGNARDKAEKNRFAARKVYDAIAPMRVLGLLRRDEPKKLWELGVPVGPICAIIPSTNPTSTVCYKALISLKAGNPIVFSPHPKALKCTLRAARIVAEAARSAGAPVGSVGCLSHASMAGCQELMAAPEIRLILATGGPGMVKAAYSSGKPAIGVGAGNGPAYIHPSAELGKALDCIVRSKCFDNGTVCASEQSIIVEKSMEQLFRGEAAKRGFYFLDTQQAGKLAKLLFRPGGGMNPEIVGKSAEVLGGMAGFSLPAGTKILVAREQEAGPTRPYSLEKLCPVLALFVMENEQAVLDKAMEVLSQEGRGHTFSIHAQDEGVIRRFAEKIPVSRFLVNAPAALGGIGAATGLFPALTLGCGAVGGSSSSNNISPLDLINIRRVAWGLEQPEAAVPAGESEENGALVELLTRKILERLEGAQKS